MNEYERRLIRLYLQAETDIINEIARLRSLGLADYHVVAALRRVQRILANMQSEAWEYAPKAVHAYFYYANYPERRTMQTTARGAMAAYVPRIRTECTPGAAKTSGSRRWRMRSAKSTLGGRIRSTAPTSARI